MSRHRRSLLLLIFLVALCGGVAVLVVRPDPVLRTVVTGGRPVAIAVDDLTRRAFVADRAGRVYVLDTLTGALIQTVPLGGLLTAVAVDRRTGRVYVANAGASSIDVLDARDGRLLRQIVGAAGAAHLAVHEATGRVFVGESGPAGSDVVVLDETSGTLARAVPGGPGMASVSYTDAPGFGGGAMAVDEATERVFAIGAHQLSVLAVRGGIGLTSVPLIPDPAAAIAVAPRAGRVFLSDAGGTRVLDARNGAVLRAIPAGRSATAIAVDEAAGRVFLATPAVHSRKTGVRTSDGSVTILAARGDAVARTLADSRAPVALAVDALRQHILIVNRDGLGVDVLDAKTGDVAWHAPVGVNPVAIAVDPRGGRAFVVNRGGAERTPDPWAPALGPLHHLFPFVPAPVDRVRTGRGGITVLDLRR